MKSVTFPNGVTTIGGFNLCENLLTVNIPDSVTSISGGSFLCCNNLTSITIPSSVTSIGMQSFSHCENLTSVIVPDSVTEIIASFRDCPNLTLHGKSGSYIESYANENNIPFIAE